MSQLVEVLGKIEEKAKAVSDLFAAEQAETKKDPSYAMPQSDREKVKSLNREIDELETKAKDQQELDGIRSKASERIRDLSAPIRPTLPGGLSTNVTFARQKSIGEQFVDSAEYKELVDSGALESDNARFKTTPFRPQVKAPGDVIGSGAGGGGAAPGVGAVGSTCSGHSTTGLSRGAVPTRPASRASDEAGASAGSAEACADGGGGGGT